MRKNNIAKLGMALCALASLSGPLRGQQVNAHQWLEQQTLPVFKPGHTLPKLGQMLFTDDLSNDTRTVRAKHYGYGVRLSRTNERANERALADLCATNPKLYRVSLFCSNMDAVPNRPEYQWPEGSYIPGTKVFSPEMPDAAFDNTIDYIMKMFETQLGGLPPESVGTIENWTEYGLHVPMSYTEMGDANPFLLKAKGDRTWRDYISMRKANYEKRLRAAIKARYPNALYSAYTYSGLEQERDSMYGFDFKYMNEGVDYASPEIYFNYFNSGFGGKEDIFSELTHTRFEEIKYNSPHYFAWLSAGYAREIARYQGDESQGVYAPMDRWMGFLKMNYTAGMLGGVTTGEFDKVDFSLQFSPDSPPPWVEQMAVLGHAHALFSWLEPVLRNSDLLEGPCKHKWSPAQPAYEFTQDDSKVMVRRTRGKDQWLVSAWAMDGVERNVKVSIPDLGDYTILARACGTVFLVEKNASGVTSRWCDENGMYPSLTASQMNGKYQQARDISVDAYTPIPVGGTKQLTVKFHPENTTNQSVVWTSSDPQIATVTPTGLVTRHREGSADITATEQEIGYHAVFQLTVPVTGIAVDIPKKEITGIGSVQLKSRIQPETATNNTITWTSDNPEVATVNKKGLVTTAKAGVATITATSDDHTKLTATCQIVVKEQPVTSIRLSPVFIEVGKSKVLSPMFTPANAIEKAVKWGLPSSSEVIMAVPGEFSCEVRGMGLGDATITATSIDGGHNATAAIKVVPVPPAPNYFNGPNTGSVNDKTGYVGYQFTVKSENDVTVFALGRFTNGTLKDDHKVQLWSVAERKLLASTTITPASLYDELGYQYESLPKPVILNTGKSYRVVSQEMAGGDTWKGLGKFAGSWGYAKIDHGVTGSGDEKEFPSAIAPDAKESHGYGGATIYAKRNHMVVGIRLNKSTSKLEVGKSEQLEAEILIQSALHSATWSSSNPETVTVSSTGLVTRRAPGHATITATSFDGYSASCVYE